MGSSLFLPWCPVVIACPVFFSGVVVKSYSLVFAVLSQTLGIRIVPRIEPQHQFPGSSIRNHNLIIRFGFVIKNTPIYTYMYM